MNNLHISPDEKSALSKMQVKSKSIKNLKRKLSFSGDSCRLDEIKKLSEVKKSRKTIFLTHLSWIQNKSRPAWLLQGSTKYVLHILGIEKIGEYELEKIKMEKASIHLLSENDDKSRLSDVILGEDVDTSEGVRRENGLSIIKSKNSNYPNILYILNFMPKRIEVKNDKDQSSDRRLYIQSWFIHEDNLSEFQNLISLSRKNDRLSVGRHEVSGQILGYIQPHGSENSGDGKSKFDYEHKSPGAGIVWYADRNVMFCEGVRSYCEETKKQILDKLSKLSEGAPIIDGNKVKIEVKLKIDMFEYL